MTMTMTDIMSDMKLPAPSIHVYGDELPDEELAQYIARGRKKYGRRLRGVDIHVDGDYVELRYDVEPAPFQRIRRITGYLVGTMDRWNDAKTAEEADRVKHA